LQNIKNRFFIELAVLRVFVALGSLLKLYWIAVMSAGLKWIADIAKEIKDGCWFLLLHKINQNRHCFFMISKLAV